MLKLASLLVFENQHLKPARVFDTEFVRNENEKLFSGMRHGSEINFVEF